MYIHGYDVSTAKGLKQPVGAVLLVKYLKSYLMFGCFRTLTSDGVSQEGVGHGDQSAIIILVFPVVLGNRLNLHLSGEKQIYHSK